MPWTPSVGSATLFSRARRLPLIPHAQPLEITFHERDDAEIGLIVGTAGALLDETEYASTGLNLFNLSLCFTDLLYMPKRPIAKAFANASWQQQQRAIQNLVTLRKNGWRGVNLQVHFDAVTQAEKVAANCLKEGDWVYDKISEELAFMRGADLRR